MPRETIACLRGLDIPVQFIHGNGDREVLGIWWQDVEGAKF